MIVSGATGSGKSTLIGAMTVEKTFAIRTPHRNIIECAEPVEFLLDRVESPTSSISQKRDPAQREELPRSFMAGAMRRQPTDIIIGECRKPEHMIATIQAAISGHADRDDDPRRDGCRSPCKRVSRALLPPAPAQGRG